LHVQSYSQAHVYCLESYIFQDVSELLNLLAKYLSTYEDSDIRQRHNLPALVDFPEETRDSRHAYKVMAAYENQLKENTFKNDDFYQF